MTSGKSVRMIDEFVQVAGSEAAFEQVVQSLRREGHATTGREILSQLVDRRLKSIREERKVLEGG